MPDDLQEVTFDTLTYGGDALGRLADGRAVFVPFALPGEQARVRVVEAKARFARGQLAELLHASEERVTPRCKHFGTCGGCHYQHLNYDGQLRVKAEILRDQLKRIGKIENAGVEKTVAAPNPWNYRNQIQFHLTQEGKLGFVRADAEQVFAVEECHLPERAIGEAWPQMEFDVDSGIERVTLRAGDDDELMLVLEGTSASLPEVEAEAGMSIVHLFEDDAVLMSGEDHLTLSLLGRGFQVSAPSFFQINTAVAEKMVKHVLRSATAAADTILDIYCGVGTFSAFLAPRCKRLIGIESSAAACKDFEANLEEFDHVELYEAPAEEVMPALEVKPDLVVLDPPRAGLAKEIVDALSAIRPARIIYVSCDPSTLARDLGRLTRDGFRLQQVTPFDMFPQTYHIESISVLERT